MKNSFILYQDYQCHIDLLNDEQAGQLLKAIFSYNQGQEVQMDPIVRMAFSFIKVNLDRDKEKYAAVTERNKTNGLKGGRPPKSGEKEENQKDTKETQDNPLGFSETQDNPKKPDTDNDTDTDTEIDRGSTVPPIVPQGGKEDLDDSESEKTPKAKKHPEPPLDIPHYIPEDLLLDFFTNRKALKKPMTHRAKELFLNKIITLYHQGHDPTKLLEEAIERGWQTVYPSNETSKGSNHENNQRPNAKNHKQPYDNRSPWERQQDRNREYLARLRAEAEAEEREKAMEQNGAFAAE
jgi:hypothetical protein